MHRLLDAHCVEFSHYSCGGPNSLSNPNHRGAHMCLTEPPEDRGTSGSYTPGLMEVWRWAHFAHRDPWGNFLPSSFAGRPHLLSNRVHRGWQLCRTLQTLLSGYFSFHLLQGVRSVNWKQAVDLLQLAGQCFMNRRFKAL